MILLLAIPMAAFSSFSDANRALDVAPSIVESLSVQKLEMRRHRRRKGGVYYTYHAYLSPRDGMGSVAVESGKWIEITGTQYQSALTAKQVVMEVGPGRLGVPWIRGLTFE